MTASNGLNKDDLKRALDIARKLIKWGEHELQDFAERLVEDLQLPLWLPKGYAEQNRRLRPSPFGL